MPPHSVAAQVGRLESSNPESAPGHTLHSLQANMQYGYIKSFSVPLLWLSGKIPNDINVMSFDYVNNFLSLTFFKM